MSLPATQRKVMSFLLSAGLQLKTDFLQKTHTDKAYRDSRITAGKGMSYTVTSRELVRQVPN